MEQMWIDKGKINTLKTFIRQPLSKPIKMPAYFCSTEERCVKDICADLLA